MTISCKDIGLAPCYNCSKMEPVAMCYISLYRRGFEIDNEFKYWTRTFDSYNIDIAFPSLSPYLKKALDLYEDVGWAKKMKVWLLLR